MRKINLLLLALSATIFSVPIFADEATDNSFIQKISDAQSESDNAYRIDALAVVVGKAEGKTFSDTTQEAFFVALGDTFQNRANDDQSSFRDSNSLPALSLLMTSAYNSPLLAQDKRPTVFGYIKQIPLEQYIAQALSLPTLAAQIRPLTLAINQAEEKSFLQFTQKVFFTALQQAFGKRLNEAKTALLPGDVITKFKQILKNSAREVDSKNTPFVLLDSLQKQQVNGFVATIEFEESIQSALKVTPYSAVINALSGICGQTAGKMLTPETIKIFIGTLKVAFVQRLQQTPAVDITTLLTNLFNTVSSSSLLDTSTRPEFDVLVVGFGPERDLAAALQLTDYMAQMAALATVINTHAAKQGNAITQKYFVDIVTNLFNNRASQAANAQAKQALIVILRTSLNSSLIDAPQKQIIQNYLNLLASEDFVTTIKQQFDARDRRTVDPLKMLLTTLQAALSNPALASDHKSKIQEMITTVQREIDSFTLPTLNPQDPTSYFNWFGAWDPSIPPTPQMQISFMQSLQQIFDNRKKQDVADLTRVKNLLSNVLTTPTLGRFLNNQKTPQDQAMVQAWVAIIANEILLLQAPKVTPGTPGSTEGFISWFSGLDPNFVPTPDTQTYVMQQLRQIFELAKNSTDTNALNKTLQLFNSVVNGKFVNNQKTPPDKQEVQGWIEFITKRVTLLAATVGVPTPTPGNAGNWWGWWSKYTGTVTPEIQALFVQQLQQLFEQLKNSNDVNLLNAFSQLLKMALTSRFVNNQKTPPDNQTIQGWIVFINNRLVSLKTPTPTPGIVTDWWNGWNGLGGQPTPETQVLFMDQLRQLFEKMKDGSDVNVLTTFSQLLNNALTSKYLNNQKTPPDRLVLQGWIVVIGSRLATLTNKPPTTGGFDGLISDWTKIPVTPESRIAFMEQLKQLFEQLKEGSDLNAVTAFLQLLNKALASSHIDNQKTPPDSQTINSWIVVITKRIEFLNKLKSMPAFNPQDVTGSSQSFLQWLGQFGTGPLPADVQQAVYTWLSNLYNSRNRQNLQSLNALLGVLNLFAKGTQVTNTDYLNKINDPMIKGVTSDINFLSLVQDVQKIMTLTDFNAKLDALQAVITKSAGATVDVPVQTYFLSAVENVFTAHYDKPLEQLNKLSQILELILKSPLVDPKQQPQIQEYLDLLTMELAIYNVVQERDYNNQLDKLIFILDGALGLPFAKQIQTLFFKIFDSVFSNRATQYSLATSKEYANINKLDYIVTTAQSSTLLRERDEQMTQDYPTFVLIEQVLVDTKGYTDYTVQLNNLATVVRNYGIRMVSKVTQDLAFDVLKIVYNARASQSQPNVTRLGQILMSMQASTLLNPGQQTEVRGWLAGMNITINGLPLIQQITQASSQATLIAKIDQLLPIITSSAAQTVPSIVQNVFASAILQVIFDARGQEAALIQRVTDLVNKAIATSMLSAAHKEYIKRAALVLTGAVTEVVPLSPPTTAVTFMPQITTAAASTDTLSKIDQLNKVVSEAKALGVQQVGTDTQAALIQQLTLLANQAKSLDPVASVKLYQLLQNTQNSPLVTPQWQGYIQSTFMPQVATTANVAVGTAATAPTVSAIQDAVKQDYPKAIAYLVVIVSNAAGQKIDPAVQTAFKSALTALTQNPAAIAQLPANVKSNLGYLISSSVDSPLLSTVQQTEVKNTVIPAYTRATGQQAPTVISTTAPDIQPIVPPATTTTATVQQPGQVAQTQVASVTSAEIKAAIDKKDPAKTINQMLMIVVRVWGQPLSAEASKELVRTITALAKDIKTISKLESAVQDKLGQLLSDVKVSGSLTATDNKVVTGLAKNYQKATKQELPAPSQAAAKPVVAAVVPVTTVTKATPEPVAVVSAPSTPATLDISEPAVAADKGRRSSATVSTGGRQSGVRTQDTGAKKGRGAGVTTTTEKRKEKDLPAGVVQAQKEAKASTDLYSLDPAKELGKVLDAAQDFVKFKKGSIPQREQSGLAGRLGQIAAACPKKDARSLSKLKSVLKDIIKNNMAPSKIEDLKKLLLQVEKDLVAAK